YLGARGVDQRRISTLGFGATQPIASNATPDGRAQNRRVEVLISPLKG
ncbi:OmpA family protein, partial [Rhizobium sp. BR5]